MFWVELVILLLLIAWGVHKGGVFLTLAGGIGAFIFTFIFKAPMADPPLTVLRIILAVVIAGGAMQAAGGIDYLVTLAEKILRKHPKSITILAPMVSWLFVFCCGTGHILWSLLPIINEIAIENGVRPERPIAASVVSSQNAVCGTPLAAATAALVGFLEEAGSIDMPAYSDLPRLGLLRRRPRQRMETSGGSRAAALQLQREKGRYHFYRDL